jgi:hypothetical protein
MSYTARAQQVLGEPYAVADRAHPPDSRADFVNALRLLSAKPPGKGARFDLGDRGVASVQTAFLRCPHEVWQRVFGEPRTVEEHAESAPLFPVQVWRYECSDGPLECVGHLVDDLYGNRWVTFVRLCFF